MALSRSTRVNVLIGNGHFLSHFYMLCLPTMFLAWQHAFDVSYAELGMTIMLMSGITAVLQTPVGFLVDKHGARRFLIGGTLLMCLSMAGMGLATAFWQVLVLAALSGIGNSVIHPADYAILSASVDKERMGRAFSIHTFSGNLGFASAPPVTAFLMALFGWRVALLTVGLVGLPVVVAIVLQSRILTQQIVQVEHMKVPMSGRQLLTSRPMLLFFAFFTFGAMANTGIQSWLVTILHTQRGIDVTVAATALTAYMAGATAGVLVGGWLSDAFRQHVMSFIVGLTIAGALAILAINAFAMPNVALIGAALVAGLILGSSRTPRDMLVRAAAPPGQTGKVFGFVSAGLPLGAAITPVPFGVLIDHGYPELVLVLVAALLIIALFCAASARVSAQSLAMAAQPAE